MRKREIHPLVHELIRGPKWLYGSHGQIKYNLVDHVLKRQGIPSVLVFEIHPYGFKADEFMDFCHEAAKHGYEVVVEGNSDWHPHALRIIVTLKEESKGEN